jgi:hypothetical protein
MRSTVSKNLPTNRPEPPRRGWAELLGLVGDLRRLAYDPSLDDADHTRRLRDRFGQYDADSTTKDYRGTQRRPGTERPGRPVSSGRLAID